MLINICVVLLFAIIAKYFHNPMMTTIVDGLIIVSLLSGILFFLATCIGILRFPDFFTRLHAAGKGDTLSTILILFASSLYAVKSSHYVDKTTLLSVFKILLIINFIFIGSPTATHALIEAGNNSEVEPWENDEKGATEN
ncbi:MAG: monovalent cation/H(+) antiporter subunit G [Candidatus Margulisiibacteriota bacterium]